MHKQNPPNNIKYVRAVTSLVLVRRLEFRKFANGAAVRSATANLSRDGNAIGVDLADGAAIRRTTPNMGRNDVAKGIDLANGGAVRDAAPYLGAVDGLAFVGVVHRRWANGKMFFFSIKTFLLIFFSPAPSAKVLQITKVVKRVEFSLESDRKYHGIQLVRRRTHSSNYFR